MNRAVIRNGRRALDANQGPGSAGRDRPRIPRPVICHDVMGASAVVAKRHGLADGHGRRIRRERLTSGASHDADRDISRRPG